MIKITVELCSARGHEHDKLLGVGVISNTGTSVDGRWGLYNVTLSKMAPRSRSEWKNGVVGLDLQTFETYDGEVDRFDRVTRGPWDLLYLALRVIVGGRNA